MLDSSEKDGSPVVKTKGLLAVMLMCTTGCNTSNLQFNEDNSKKQALTQKGNRISIWVTHPDKSKLLQRQPNSNFRYDNTANQSTLNIDDLISYQKMEGFGAAITDASAWLLYNKLTTKQRAATMKKLFSNTEGSAGISYIRLPLGASDMALSHYTYNDLESGATDLSLERFSLEHDSAYILPILKQAQLYAPELQFMGSPWSPPAWMKDSQNLNYGKLQEKYQPVYAKYLRKAIDGYANWGIKFSALTIQNEPQYEPYSYPGAKYEWYDELNFVRYHLKAQLNGTKIKLLTFDHNWDMLWYPKAVMNEGQDLYDGSAWHCYGGSPDAMSEMKQAYPQKSIYLTECTGGQWATDFQSNLKWNMQNMFIGGTRNWASAVLLWNIALDPDGNPHTGGCSNCRGVITIDPSTGQVVYNEEFYAIAHFARFVKPGARRIETTLSADGKFIGVAFKNPNGTIAAVVFNQSSSSATFRIRWKGMTYDQALPANGLVTLVW